VCDKSNEPEETDADIEARKAEHNANVMREFGNARPPYVEPRNHFGEALVKASTEGQSIGVTERRTSRVSQPRKVVRAPRKLSEAEMLAAKLSTEGAPDTAE
jgi:hypothetical protein